MEERTDTAKPNTTDGDGGTERRWLCARGCGEVPKTVPVPGWEPYGLTKPNHVSFQQAKWHIVKDGDEDGEVTRRLCGPLERERRHR